MKLIVFQSPISNYEPKEAWSMEITEREAKNEKWVRQMFVTIVQRLSLGCGMYSVMGHLMGIISEHDGNSNSFTIVGKQLDFVDYESMVKYSFSIQH